MLKTQDIGLESERRGLRVMGFGVYKIDSQSHCSFSSSSTCKVLGLVFRLQVVGLSVGFEFV